MMSMKLIAKNRRASYDYAITETLVGGIVLTGDEVKSAKASAVSLKGSFIALRDNEAYLTNAHINPYEHANAKLTIEPLRSRKLLFHRRQLEDLVKAKQTGLSVVPTALLLDRGLVKLEVGIGRGKKRHDKRQVIKQRETMREMARQVKR